MKKKTGAPPRPPLARQEPPRETLATLSAAAQRAPQDPAIHWRLGNLLAGAQQWAAAERCYARVCALQPAHAAAQHNHGVSLQELGRVAEAIGAYERAIAARPDYATAFHSLGLAYQAIAAHEAALLAFETALSLQPGDAGHAIEQARTRVTMGQFTAALAELDALAALRPRDAVIANLRGIALKQLHRGDEAMAAFDRAIALAPTLAEAFNNRAGLLMRTRRFSAAVVDCEAALALKPSLDWLPGTRLYAAAHAFDWTDHAQRLAALVDGVRAGRKAVQPLALQVLVDEPALQQQAARLWTKSACAPLAEAPRAVAREDGRIRLAYIAKDFRSSPVAYLIAEVFELHDRERFELIALNYGAASADPMQQRLRAACDRFIDVQALSDAAVAQLARELGVDIAIDLSGFTDEARSGIFARRAAPLQLSYLGYLGTSGARLYDYLIADETLVPPQARPCYDEALALLPSYQANDRQRPRPAPALRPAAGFVFCCFNNPCKIGPALFARWMRILAAVPGSVLWLLDEDGEAPANLRRHAQQAGIDGARILFAKRTSREGYLANLAAADLFLDTLPYNAGTTASDALWMGLPVLTQRGRSIAGRMAASLVDAVGLPELVVETEEAYETMALALAQQADRLAAVKARLLAQRESCWLFDTPRFTRSLEATYTEMQRLAIAGEAPRDLKVT